MGLRCGDLERWERVGGRTSCRIDHFFDKTEALWETESRVLLYLLVESAPVTRSFVISRGTP